MKHSSTVRDLGLATGRAIRMTEDFKAAYLIGVSEGYSLPIDDRIDNARAEFHAAPWWVRWPYLVLGF